MPKNRKVVKINNRVVKLKVPHKLRIGTRSAGKSAFLMTTAELKEVLENRDKKRWHQNARKVLNMRGVTI